MVAAVGIIFLILVLTGLVVFFLASLTSMFGLVVPVVFFLIGVVACVIYALDEWYQSGLPWKEWFSEWRRT